MKRALGLFIVALWLWSPVAGALPARDAEVLVKETADTVIARVKSERDLLRRDSGRLHRLVDELIIPHFDFARMSQWVLGKHWRAANPAQRARFISEFRLLLIKTYATALLEYADREFRYYPARAIANTDILTIRSDIAQPGSGVIPISYRMHVQDNRWKVYDVSVDGVSLVATYRASFASEVRKSGIDGLITSLAAKNAK